VEYLVVYFDDDRGVIVNSAPGAWTTNQILMLEAGMYYIELAPPADFTPLQIPIQLVDTAVDNPYQLYFTKTS
jgi:hypothetical protein